ncbi:MAG: adenylyltransferase/cytidyltransferase family protein [Sphingobium sp.]
MTGAIAMIRVITFGTFDLFHIGHVRILERARALGDHLTVGVSTDQLNFSKKAKYPIYSEQDRMGIVAALKCVDAVFPEHSLELKESYILEHGADVLVMGHDWEGRFDDMGRVCKVLYLPRTEGISSTDVKARVAATQGGAAA